MSVTETLMADGAFSVQLKPDAPTSAVGLLLSEEDALIKIYKAVLPVAAVAAGALPLYTGYRTGSRQWGEVNGLGVVALLGNSLAAGQQIGTGWRGYPVGIDKRTGPAYLSDWVNALVGNGITVGAATVGSGIPLPLELFGSARAVLDYVCGWLSGEYMVSPDLKLWVGTRTELFGDPAVPVVPFVAPDSAGYDARVRGLAAIAPQYTVTSQDRINRVYTTSATVPYDTGVPADGHHAPDGTQLQMATYQGDYQTATEATAARDATLASGSQPTRQFTMQTEPFDVDFWNDGSGPSFRHHMPGLTVGAYDPAHNIFDLSNQMVFRGRTIFPVAVRCVKVEWPIRTGYGVYLDNRHNGGTITDLTPYVAFEDGAKATLTLGQLPKQLDGTRHRTFDI